MTCGEGGVKMRYTVCKPPSCGEKSEKKPCDGPVILCQGFTRIDLLSTLLSTLQLKIQILKNTKKTQVAT